MKILAIDTATSEAAVALHIDGRVRERGLAWRAAFRQSAPAMESLLEEAGLAWSDLDGLAVPAGPGSFTGLRVGAAMALAIAELGRIPLFAPSTLAVVAEAAAPAGATPVCASLDARRGRRYAAILERGEATWAIVRGPVDIDADSVETWAGTAADVRLEGRELRSSPAAALAALVARAPDAFRLATPRALRIAYARPPTEKHGSMSPQPPGLEVRRLGKADLPAVVALERSIYPAPWPPEHFVRVSALPGAIGRVALLSDGSLAGYALGWVAADEAELANLAVADAQRRQGVGGRLLEAMRAAARERGASRMYLEVRVSNHAARSFYGAHGFKATGRRRDYYNHPREDALTMAVDLTQDAT